MSKQNSQQVSKFSGLHLDQCKMDDLDEIMIVEARSFTIDAYPRSKFTRLLDRCKDAFLVARLDKKIVAYIAAFITDSEGYIDSMAVLPEYRKMGIGRFLVETVREKLAGKDARALTLHVRTSNKEAITLYEKSGFQVEDTVPAYYSDGTPAYYMTLQL